MRSPSIARAGVEVRLVGHKELRSFREHHLGLPDKDDDADAARQILDKSRHLLLTSSGAWERLSLGKLSRCSQT
jgi:hypothetical protein